MPGEFEPRDFDGALSALKLYCNNRADYLHRSARALLTRDRLRHPEAAPQPPGSQRDGEASASGRPSAPATSDPA